MRKEVFEKKAASMEDFIIYYQKPGDENAKIILSTVVSYNLDNDYIQARLRNSEVYNDKAVLWNWTANRRLVVDYSRIKKLIPLASVLKNHR